MPAVVEHHPAQLPAEVRRKLTRADCRALETAGLLAPERFELCDGELIRKMGKSPLHSLALHLLLEWLRDTFGSRHVQQEVSIRLGPQLDATNELEPDAVVLRRPVAEFRTEYPGPADLSLVVEVSATTREYDLGAKAAIYARAAIPEYWVLDLRDMRVVVHRNPEGERWGSILAYAAEEAVVPLAAPFARVRLQDLVSGA